jgi:flagellar hook-basal body complex protein FliE
MLTNAANAVSAYLKAAGQGTGPGMDAPAPESGGDFADLVKGALKGAAETVKRGEEASLKAAFDEAQMTDVVTAVATAEVTLQTVVAVRDRVVQAYQQILRMPI